jgi:hypothetical protein
MSRLNCTLAAANFKKTVIAIALHINNTILISIVKIIPIIISVETTRLITFPKSSATLTARSSASLIAHIKSV